jgi:hypothetical protein
LGVISGFSIDAQSHSSHFCSSYLFGKENQSVMCVACCWQIWKEKNNRVFIQKKMTIALMFDKIKILMLNRVFMHTLCLTVVFLSYFLSN